MVGRKKTISENPTIKIPARLLRIEVAADSDKPLQFPDSSAPGPSLDDKGFNEHLSKAEQSGENLPGEDDEVEVIEDEE
jgi:hypothetical protein